MTAHNKTHYVPCSPPQMFTAQRMSTVSKVESNIDGGSSVISSVSSGFGTANLLTSMCNSCSCFAGWSIGHFSERALEDNPDPSAV